MTTTYGVWAWWDREGQILGFSIDFRRRPYNTLALPCECVIHRAFIYNSMTIIIYK